jgi:hypothetical protein
LLIQNIINSTVTELDFVVHPVLSSAVTEKLPDSLTTILLEVSPLFQTKLG